MGRPLGQLHQPRGERDVRLRPAVQDAGECGDGPIGRKHKPLRHPQEHFTLADGLRCGHRKTMREADRQRGGEHEGVRPSLQLDRRRSDRRRHRGADKVVAGLPSTSRELYGTILDYAHRINN